MRVFSLPSSFSLRPRWGAVRLGFALAAAAFAYQGFARFGESRQNFNEAMAWYAVALACTVVFAYEGTAPAVRGWPARLLRFLRRHWLEGVFLLSIVGIAVFMRLFRFGDYPPSGLICCAEDEIGNAVFNLLNGGHILRFPILMYSTWVGFLTLGDNTTGFRVPSLVLGVVTIIPFYILLRHMVSVPVALFASALLASSRLFLDVTARHEPQVLEAVLLVLFLVRGMKTGSPLMFAGLGLMSGLISYEYEAFKPVAIVALGYIAAAAVFSLLRPPINWSELLERGRSLARKAWRPAIAFSLAGFIAIGPLLVGLGDGEDLYFYGFSRNRDVRERQGDTGFLPADWQDRVEWGAQQVWPFGESSGGIKDPYFGPKENRPLLDPVTGTLMILGVAFAVVTFWRQFRLFFLVWFVGSAVGSSLLDSALNPSSFLVTFIPGFVLIAFLIDDARRHAVRLLGQRAVRLAPLLLVLAAGYIVFWNASTFNTIANNPANPAAFARPKGQNYATCNYLQEQGDDNYSYAMWAHRPRLGFHHPHVTPQEQVRAWRDFRFICHDLEGANPIAPEEAWPIAPPQSAASITFAFLQPLTPLQDLDATLQRAYPGLGPPEKRLTGPDDGFTLVGYQTDADLVTRRGLWADYFPPGGESAALSRLDPAHSLSWAQVGLPLPAPFTVRWRGVVQLAEGGSLSLSALTDDPVEVLLDGRTVYSTRQGKQGQEFVDLLPGWHPLEITLDKRTEGGTVDLSWLGPDGGTLPVHADDLFPLESLDGWLHTRTMALDDGRLVESQRLDFTVHYSSSLALIALTQQATRQRASPEMERWRSVWNVPEDHPYVFNLETRNGTAALFIDGEPVLTVGGEGAPKGEASIFVPAGRHELQVEQRQGGGDVWTGARLSISDPSGTTYTPALSPF